MPSRSEGKESNDFWFRFWGVRGSIATPGAHTVRHGGNTPCIEVHVGGRLVILDGGTGLRALGQSLVAAGAPVDADLFLTHLHWDHIQGIPFFTPAFIGGNRFRIYGERKGQSSLRAVLEGQMTDPNFPVPLSVMASELDINEICAGDSVDVGDGVMVYTAPMNHPNGCLGIRVECGGKTLVYATDTEHDTATGQLDANVIKLAQDADVLIYDSMYTEEELRAGKIGWGHSTFEEAIRIAHAANVGKLLFFHHDPARSDDALDAKLVHFRAQQSAGPFELDMAREGEMHIV